MPFADNIAACIAIDLATRFIVFSTILHLVIVTFECYVMVLHPIQYRKIISKQTTVASLILIWIFSMSMSLIQLFWISLDSIQTMKHERCMDAIYSYCCFVFLVVLPVILLAIIHVRIFLVLRLELKKIRRPLPRARITHTALRKEQPVSWTRITQTRTLGTAVRLVTYPPQSNVCACTVAFVNGNTQRRSVSSFFALKNNFLVNRKMISVNAQNC